MDLYMMSVDLNSQFGKNVNRENCSDVTKATINHIPTDKCVINASPRYCATSNDPSIFPPSSACFKMTAELIVSAN